MILQQPGASRWEVDEAGQKGGAKREQCCPVLFSVCCVRPTAHSEPHRSSTPDLSRHSATTWPQFPCPYAELTLTSLYLCAPPSFARSTRSTILRNVSQCFICTRAVSSSDKQFASRSSLKYSKCIEKFCRRSHAT